MSDRENLGRMSMHVETYEPKPKPRYVDARPLGWLGIVAIVALFVAALVIARGVF